MKLICVGALLSSPSSLAIWVMYLFEVLLLTHGLTVVRRGGHNSKVFPNGRAPRHIWTPLPLAPSSPKNVSVFPMVIDVGNSEYLDYPLWGSYRSPQGCRPIAVFTHGPMYEFPVRLWSYIYIRLNVVCGRCRYSVDSNSFLHNSLFGWVKLAPNISQKGSKIHFKKSFQSL